MDNIISALKQNGFSLYVVGGYIRDSIIGRATHDIDLATSAHPDELMEIFPKANDVGAKFGTIVVDNIQITTFRSDRVYSDSRHPDDVSYSDNIYDDLKRRDFTINSMALEIGDDFGNYKTIEEYVKNNLDKVIDLYGGVDDIQKKLVKATGNPKERMLEDYLRSMRAVRFASILEFSIDSDTFDAIKYFAKDILKISVERIRDELIKILNDSPIPSYGIELLRESGILEVIMPELLEGIHIEQNKFHTETVYMHLIHSCDKAQKDVRLVSLLHDIGKPRTKEGEHFYSHEIVGSDMAKDILKRLKFPKKDILKIILLIKMHMFNYSEDWKDSSVRRFLSKIPSEDFLNELFLLREADIKSNPLNTTYDNLLSFKKRIEEVKRKSNVLTRKDLAINGDDLKQLGYSGKEIGEELETLLSKVLEDPELNTREELIKLVCSKSKVRQV